MLFKLSNLNSNLALTLGYLNPALNNSALEATTFGTLNVSTLLETIWRKVWARSLLSNTKSPLLVDGRRLKTFFFKLTFNTFRGGLFFRGGGGGYYQMYCLLVVGPITCGEGLISFVSFGTSFLFCT